MNNAHEENISSVTGFKSTSGSPAIGSSLPGRSGKVEVHHHRQDQLLSWRWLTAP